MAKQMIAQGQKPCITVITAKNPTEQEKYAAWELVHYLNLMGSVSIPTGDETTQGPVIAIGSAAARLGVTADPKLSYDGFTLKTVGDSLAIVGGIRGVIYGVYELLEKLGCRFFTPLCEKIPSVVDIELPQLDETQIPVLEYRQHNYTDFTKYPRFGAKSRLNSLLGAHIPDYLGGGIEYAWFGHSFLNILDPEEWFDTHPEYFSLVNGKRVREFSQLCLTNPDVQRIAIEKVRDTLRAHPECRIISVSQNDWANHCECDACRKLDEQHESYAGSLIHFVNHIAEALEKEFPEVIIDTFAYRYSRPAPKHIHTRANVCVRLCSIEACFAHPLEACDVAPDPKRFAMRPDGTKTKFIEDLTGWGKVCERVYIWDYTTGFAHYPAPHPNWAVLQPNIRTFIKNNAKGIFEQACGAIGGSVDLNEMRAYVISKLLWDADTDVERHIREFSDFYYGAAAPYIREYIQVHTDKVVKDNIHVGFNDQCDRPDLSDEMLDIYDAILAKAAKAVEGDPIRAMRVNKAQLATRWVRLKNNAMLKDIHNPDEINQFFEDWRAHGLTRIDEWVSAETTHRALIENLWRGTEYYHHWSDEGPERL